MQQSLDRLRAVLGAAHILDDHRRALTVFGGAFVLTAGALYLCWPLGMAFGGVLGGVVVLVLGQRMQESTARAFPIATGDETDSILTPTA